ncbi:MAG: bifunctional aldolase/short-chain dehydrogenase [Rhodospirillaceae bacterium]|nr:bifunctional aldolase/short-chain dehydrogenase [Rhodospirillaceae bacterium]|tara:strand:+ start:28842 stop:30887 length:2046 start_codon:yes stop_codon:yes gene_type:complete
MENLWSDEEARSYISRFVTNEVNEDLALRVYTSRLLGGEPKLVLHGGGNTSVKTTMPDTLGESIEVLCVKGSGWDLGDIEPPGLPAVRLGQIRKLAALPSLTDEEMVNAQRLNLLESAAPTPSVETLLHAFLPHKFVDHTHANAILALTDQEGGDEICQEIFGNRMGYVPYIMPGFALAKKAKEVFEENPSVEGLILFKHGIFTFGETAQESYDRMIEMVTLAENEIKRRRSHSIEAIDIPAGLASVVEIAPILRGLCAIETEKSTQRLIMDFRSSEAILNFVNGKDLERYSQQGTVTPDHVIRTKPNPLVTPLPEVGKLEEFKAAAKVGVQRYIADYRAYFSRNNEKQVVPKTELDPMPRVILVPGVGLFGLGNSAGAAAVAADLAETNIDVITDVESMGVYKVIPESDIFDIEYWSLEQAKLGKSAEKPLQRQIAAVTGGGSGIGAATARAFANAGAVVVVLDRDESSAASIAADIGGLGLGCDVTNIESVKSAFALICERFGGLDLLVSNAGAAWQGKIGEVDDAVLRESFELNFFAHQSVAKAAVEIMRAQGTGGCLLFNTSKQAINPGPDFGPYGLPKAATLFLMKQYALDYGAEGIRSNAVNADRIRTGLLDDEMIAARSKARGVSEADYMGGNLLRREVLAEDVAKAFLDLALAEKTTAAVVTVDGGNIAASLR